MTNFVQAESYVQEGPLTSQKTASCCKALVSRTVAESGAQKAVVKAWPL